MRLTAEIWSDVMCLLCYLGKHRFAAYFTDGKNVGQLSVRLDLARAAGLDPEDTRAVLAADAYANVVRSDITTAAQLGIDGVPFFVFDRKYAVAGAQEVAVFRNALQASRSS